MPVIPSSSTSAMPPAVVAAIGSPVAIASKIETPRPSFSEGCTKMSAAAFGHTGSTGTSLWIDPQRDRYFVLLTNRAYTGASGDELQSVRRAFHDALGDV